MAVSTLRLLLLATGFIVNPLSYAFRTLVDPAHVVHRRFGTQVRISPTTFNGRDDGNSCKQFEENHAYSSDYSGVPLLNVPVLEVDGRAMFPGNRDVLQVYELAWLDFFQRLLSLGSYGERPASPLIISAAALKAKSKTSPRPVSKCTGPVPALAGKDGRGIFYGHFLRGERVGVVMRVLDYRELDNGATLLVCAQAVARVTILDSQEIARLPRVPGSMLLMSPGGTASLALMHDDEEVAAAASVLDSSEVTTSSNRNNFDPSSDENCNGNNLDDSTLAEAATGAWCAAWANFDIPPVLETPRWYLRGIDALAPMACAPLNSENNEVQVAAAQVIANAADNAAANAAANAVRSAYSTAPEPEGIASEEISKHVSEEHIKSSGSKIEATESTLASLKEVEAAVWAELEMYVAIAGSLRSSGVFCLPSALLALRPALAPSALHPARRAWRLSYALAAMLPDLPKGRNTHEIRPESQSRGEADGSGSISGGDGEAVEDTARAQLSRQVLLEETSTTKRLQRLLQELEGERRMMAAAKIMESISRDHGDNRGKCNN